MDRYSDGEDIVILRRMYSEVAPVLAFPEILESVFSGRKLLTSPFF